MFDQTTLNAAWSGQCIMCKSIKKQSAKTQAVKVKGYTHVADRCVAVEIQRERLEMKRIHQNRQLLLPVRDC